MENLTKENFFNEMYIKYPISMQRFCNWIDKYKKEVNWNELFGEKVKFHHLPISMQRGIWDEYYRQNCGFFGYELTDKIKNFFKIKEDYYNELK